MSDTDPRISRFVQEVLDSGRAPEEVCAEATELLGVVRERLKLCRSVEAELDALFPTSGSSQGSHAKSKRRTVAGEAIPQIPGYRVEAVLGRGGMGVVYRARHLRLNRAVAIKMLLLGDYAAPRERLRFAREAEAVAGLRHEHIVQVYDVGDHEGRPYFTMEHVEGGSLAQRLAAGPLPAREAAALSAKLARAVQVAHQSGIVHRDLKPANILLASDGTPKISDFGLARRLTGEAELTASGARVGTPSYMAPEQAVGRAGAAGPLVDVYALGAMLYEMLTGRPPFTSESPVETQRKLLSEEPVAPSRLNAKVPRDLQTICLKCLCKDPQRRYGTPAALADDLDRFLRGETVMARPARWPERAAKWGLRHPSAAALLIGGALLASALVVGGLWLHFDRAANAKAVVDGLREVRRHEAAGRWADARLVLTEAKGRLGSGGTATLRAQVSLTESDLNTVGRFATILRDRASVVGGRFNMRLNKARADRAYEEMFRDAGYGDLNEKPQVVADRIVASQVRDALIGALDDWAICASDKGRRAWILSAAQLADRPGDERRNRLRDPAWRDDRTSLEELTRIALEVGPSVQLMVALGELLHDRGGDAVPFLTQVQLQHPADFWANFALGEVLRQQHSPEAMRYFQAALAADPHAAVAYNNLGITLRLDGRVDEAAEHFRLAIRTDRAYAPAHNNLGMDLASRGQLDEAIAHFSEALQSDPDDADTHNNLGLVLAEKHRMPEAIAHYQRAVQIYPDDAPAHNNLGLALRATGQLHAAIDHFRAAVRVSPNDPGFQNNLGLALREDHQLADAIQHFVQALRIRPNYLEARTNAGIAYAMNGQLDEAIAQYQMVQAANDKDGGNHNNLGIALVATGRMAEAIEQYRRALQINPDDGPAHNNLGIALRNTGRFDEAIEHFEAAIRINAGDVAARDNLRLAHEAKQKQGGHRTGSSGAAHP